MIDRRVIWKSTVILQLNVTSPAGVNPMNIAVSDALAPFPLHQLATVMTATINNNSVSLNVRDVLPALLRFHDRRELSRYNGMTPTAHDLIANYAQGIGANNNVLGSWANSTDPDLLARGAFRLDGVSTTLTAQGGLPSPCTVFTAAQIAAGINNQPIYVQFTVSEPLLLSPFIWADCQANSQAFYGIQNMNFVFNIGDASRVWRTANTSVNVAGGTTPFNNTYIQSANVVSFNDTQLLFNFLTPHPSDLFPARNSVPFWEAPRFITSNFAAIDGFIPSLTNLTPPVKTLVTSSLQLNQIPDKIILQVRNRLSDCAWGNPDAFLGIQGVSISFNNQSGILASATQQDLYRYSVENGYNGNFQEFAGFATLPDPASGFGRIIPTSGSLLILEFGKDIQLTEDYYAAKKN